MLHGSTIKVCFICSSVNTVSLHLAMIIRGIIFAVPGF